MAEQISNPVPPQLKPDALADLDLPIVVKAGLLGSLTLKVRGRMLFYLKRIKK